MVTYILRGNPIPLARGRYSRQGKVYDSQKLQRTITTVTLQSQHDGRPFYTGPLVLDVTFFMPIPMSHSRKKLEGTPHVKTPDLDNLLKWVCDCATNVCYKNDSIIVKCIAEKLYDKNPRTEFRIRPWTKDHNENAKKL